MLKFRQDDSLFNPGNESSEPGPPPHQPSLKTLLATFCHVMPQLGGSPLTALSVRSNHDLKILKVTDWNYNRASNIVVEGKPWNCRSSLALWPRLKVTTNDGRRSGFTVGLFQLLTPVKLWIRCMWLRHQFAVRGVDYSPAAFQ